EAFVSTPSPREEMAARSRATAETLSWERALDGHEDAWKAALAHARDRLDAVPRPAERALPAGLSGLARLAKNLWWTWDAEARSLFEDLSPRAWRAARHSPVRLLRSVAAGGVPAAAHDPAYAARVSQAVRRLEDYLAA